MPRERYLVSGRVQGVGFRYFTREAALRHGIHGFVRNLSDGRVEVVAQADDNLLAQFLTELGEGPPGSRVDGIDRVESGDELGKGDEGGDPEDAGSPVDLFTIHRTR